MSNDPVFVSIQLGAETHLVGKLWWHGAGRQRASFEYDSAWLGHEEKFALDPALQLGGGKFHTMADQTMFGAIGDSSPDRWGRLLMRKKATKDDSPAPSELDFLLGVSDEARQGALRFSLASAGPYLSDTAGGTPSISALPNIFSATNKYLDDNETAEDLKLLLAPGSSMGGARPKASVRDWDGNLVLVKFPNRGEQHDVVMWEAVTLVLASKAGINTAAPWRLETINGKRVLILRRFDRVAGERIPFLSARSMLAVNDYDRGSYLDIAYALAQHGACPDRDMEQLWRRIVFTVMISNLDDHLRNHGFLYEQGEGWRLSPAYDINPEPTTLGDPMLSTPIKYDAPLASMDVALSVIGDFRIKKPRANEIIGEVAAAINGWRNVAAELGLDEREMDMVAPAFRHEDWLGG